MTDQTIEPNLTADNVRKVYQACLGDENASLRIEGIVTNTTFSQEAIDVHRDKIAAMLADLPDQFQLSKGGGWSFLNACHDKHGNQWTGFHEVMEKLFSLGMAAGKVKCLMPRDMWDVLPGGMPYYAVLDQ